MKDARMALLASLAAAMVFPLGCSKSDRGEETDTASDGNHITLEVGRGVTMKLVRVPAGTFMMGSPDEESQRKANEKQHRVTITRDFYMGVYEVTQRQHGAVMGTNPSRYQGLDNPVETISWDDAEAFCRKLSRITKVTVQLPTEAQWEYACRAGTITPFNTGRTISTAQANYDGAAGEVRGKTMAAGSFRPNAFGLYDMHGNVWEWCRDRYAPYPSGDATDPQGPPTGEGRVLRGGSWRHKSRECRSANRDTYRPDRRDSRHGFRVVVYP